MNITFYGVRGSTPCSSDANARYGGNTSSVVIEVPDTPPILLDLGTGLRFFGETLPSDRPISAVALVSHLHWDHVQGLPFFGPALRPGSRVDVYSVAPDCGMTLAQAFNECLRPPFFPVRLCDLCGDFSFTEIDACTFEVGEVTVTAAPVPHLGPTLGFRLDWRGRSLAFIPDHQEPVDGSSSIAQEVLDLAADVDLLIHDAQYTADEFRAKRDWGHSTVEYAVHVAAEANARMLALFHHDPAHSDDFVDRLAAEARLIKGCRTMEIFAAHEGLTVVLSAR